MTLHRITGVLAAIVVLFVSACALFGGGGGSGPSPVPAKAAQISCADVRNPDRPSACVGQKSVGLQIVPEAVAAETVVDRGQVSRSELISVASTVDNLTAGPFEGWVEARFDAGCNGADEWVIVPRYAVQIGVGESVNVSAGGQCGDMPLGPRTLTATAYAADGTTVVDRVIVRFELVD
ncbi:MAG: hypothetical protein GC151_13965 [Betaproteobacteria bacterium]|nr:hypothetical protein [Betaproteobacteria bacterium]